MRKIPKIVAVALAALMLAGCSRVVESPVADPAPAAPAPGPTEAFGDGPLSDEIIYWAALTDEVFGECFTTFGNIDSYDFYEDQDGWSVGILYIYFDKAGTFTFAVGTNEAGQDVTIAYGDRTYDKLEAVGCYG